MQTRLLWTGLVFGAAMTASADTAFCVGVDSYPFLKDKDLPACGQDASRVAQALKTKFGFDKIVLITGKDTTQDNILTRLAQCVAELKKDERFVFYHSGHGTVGANGEGQLLTSSSTPEGAGDISRSELFAIFSKVEATTSNCVTIIDACFSEGILSKLGTSNQLISKFYRREGAPNVPKIDVLGGAVRVQAKTYSKPQNLQHQIGSSLADQQSYIKDYGGKKSSIFTNSLLKAFDANPKTWAEVTRFVQADVFAESEGQQKPTYRGNGGGPLFGGGETVSKPTQISISDLNELLAYDNINTDVLDLEMVVDGKVYSPSTTIYCEPKASKCSFSVRVARQGYLFVLNRDSDDNVQVIWPDLYESKAGSKSFDALLQMSKVEANSIHQAPPGASDIEFRSVSQETVKAIHFDDREEALRFLRLAKRTGLLEAPVLRKNLVLSKSGSTSTSVVIDMASLVQGFVTSEITFFSQPRESKRPDELIKKAVEPAKPTDTANPGKVDPAKPTAGKKPQVPAPQKPKVKSDLPSKKQSKPKTKRKKKRG